MSKADRHEKVDYCESVINAMSGQPDRCQQLTIEQVKHVKKEVCRHRTLPITRVSTETSPASTSDFRLAWLERIVYPAACEYRTNYCLK